MGRFHWPDLLFAALATIVAVIVLLRGVSLRENSYRRKM
jgi:hypothetical protein